MHQLQKRNVEISSIIVDFFISHLYLNFCFKNFEALLLSEYIFRIILSWIIYPFVRDYFSFFSDNFFWSILYFILIWVCQLFFWSLFVWWMVFYSNSLNLSLSLYWNEFLVDDKYLGLDFISNLTVSAFLLVYWDYFYLMLLFIWLN